MWAMFQLSFLNLWPFGVPLCKYNVYLFSIDCSHPCCGFDHEFHSLHCGYLGAFGLFFYFTKENWQVESKASLRSSRSTQEQNAKQTHQEHHELKLFILCPNLLAADS